MEQSTDGNFSCPVRITEPALQDTWSLPRSVAGISRYNSDCHPSITADGHLMAFCAHCQNGPPYDTIHFGFSFNVYTARWNGTTWDSVRNAGANINAPLGASYPTISPGGDTIFFVKGSKLWMSIWQDTGWSVAVKLPYPVNDSNPQVKDGPCAISFDGKQLYFRSDRLGGYGSGDIWVVRITPAGFDSLTNLGPNVNTSDMETHPAISPDGQRLYFSDFGGARPTWKYGDCDIYVSHWTGSSWGPAQILEAPVNTDLPCCSAFETTDGRLFLGSEVSEGTYGEEDIWVCSPTKIEKIEFNNFLPLSHRGWQNTGELAGATYVYDLVEKEGTIYAATAPNGDVFKTTNAGQTWQNTGEILGETHIYSLLVAQDGSILAGTYPNGKLFRTTNNGATWNEVWRFPYARAVRKIFQKSDGTLFVGTSPDSNGMGRVWRSTDNGVSWQRTANLPQVAGGIFAFYEASGGVVLAGARTKGDKFYVSTNNGNTWNIGNLPYPDTLVTLSHLYFFYRTSDGYLWTGGWAHGPQGILLYSTNNGITWDTCGVIPNGGMIVARVFDMVEDTGGAYFIGFHPGPDSVVFRSTDGGLTWHSVGTLEGAYECLTLLRTSDGTIYAGTTPNGDVFKYELTGIEEEKASHIKVELLQSFPTPFNSKTTIVYQLATRSRVSLKVYNIAGELVKTLVDRVEGRGYYTLDWDGKDSSGKEVDAGIYFCQLNVGNSTDTKKIILIK